MGTENKSIQEEKISVEDTPNEQKVAENSNVLVFFLF